ncbi:MAG: hypothetical protein LBC70_05740 [Chitinispirillales bacterium]|jgi:hypothetical protein|nr:hypothetical protein [Chitinispirillales bacterium]
MNYAPTALFIEYFNILSVTVMAFFALYGLIAVFWKRSALNIFRGKIFIQAFCVAAIFAFALEATVFNFQYYLKYTAGEEFYTTEVSPQDSTIILTSDTTVSANIRIERQPPVLVPNTRTGEKDTAWLATGITFKNINRAVASIYIEPVFGKIDQMALFIEIIDGNGISKTRKIIWDGFPRDNHIPLQQSGKISEITIAFPGHDLLGKISRIAINKPIPFYFSGLRLFAVSCLLFALILFLRKELRAQISYFLFEYKFDPASKKQKSVYAFIVALVILFSFITAFTSTSKFFREEYLTDRQYNVFLVDAILGGRTYLDAGRPEMLTIAERPYDLQWLTANGYHRDYWWFSDWAYYQGKFYCYFGIVPAIILYVPYKMITGEYLSNNAGIFIFIAIATILLAALWRHCVKKYMPDMRFAFYLLSFLALFFASGTFVPLRFTRFYSILSAGGFMFVIAGIFLLLKSIDNEQKLCKLKVFFGCLCFALAVGCRPNLALASIIVPVVLWRYRSFKLAALILLPYTLIAVPLCYYNYVRFDSVFEFGAKYNMTNLNVAAYNSVHPLGRLINTFTSSVTYLFTANKYSFFFPYVESVGQVGKLSFITRMFYDKGVGIINFPIVFCLFFCCKAIFAKVRPKSLYLPAVFLIIAAVTILANSWLIGYSSRYMIDFAIFIIFASVFGAYYWCNSETVHANHRKNRLKAIYVLLGLTIFVGLALFAGDISNDPSPSDPVLYRYLQHSLGLIGSI